MKTSIAAALAGLAMASTPTLGADLFGTAPPPMTLPGRPEPAHRGRLQLVSARRRRHRASTRRRASRWRPISMPTGRRRHPALLRRARLVASRHDDFSADIGVGYRFNNWLRFEGTYEYRTAAGRPQRQQRSSARPRSRRAGWRTAHRLRLRSPGPTPRLHRRPRPHIRRNSTALASAYLDLGNYWGVTPYVGAGAGLNANMISGSVGYTVNADGTAYSADLTAVGEQPPKSGSEAHGRPRSTQPNIGFANQNWNRSISSTHYSMAWALMAGFGIQLSPERDARRRLSLSQRRTTTCWSRPRPARRSSCPTCRRTSASASATWPTDCGGGSPGRSLDADGGLVSHPRPVTSDRRRPLCSAS